MPEPAKSYLESPKPSVRLACGNCGSKKIFKIEEDDDDSDRELELAECEDCGRIFAICPSCKLPTGLEIREMEEFQRFIICPNCNINFTLNTTNPNEYLEMWKTPPKANNYPLGNPEVKYNTKGGLPMDDLSIPSSQTNNPVPVPSDDEEEESVGGEGPGALPAKVTRRRKRPASVEEVSVEE